MTPRELRLKSGEPELSVAAKLGIGVGTLNLLEATPVQAWTIQQLGQHCAACGYALRVLATDQDGKESEIT